VSPARRRATARLPRAVAQRIEIVQLRDLAEIAERACERVLAAAKAAIAERGAFRIALSGGSTPKALYERLAAREGGAEVARWHVYFGDERCVPPEHPDSNFGMAREAWLGRSRIPPEQVHRIRGELAPLEAAERYESELRESFATREVPRFDVVLLGLGADGHTASLFPGSSALAEPRRLVASTHVESLGADRVTLTLRAINASLCVLFLVAGEDKAGALRDVLHAGSGPERLPAGRVAPWDGSLVWLVDRAAASKLAESG
jgi:6-phosphogluconolactonase